MKKKAAATSIILIILSSIAISGPIVADPATTMFVFPSTKTVNPNDTFTIDVKINDVISLTCWEFTLHFNNAVLECTNALEGPFLKSGGNTYFTKTIDNANGMVHLGCTLMGLDVQVNGNGVLASITFNAIASGDSTLDLADTKLGDTHLPPEDISHTTSDGTVHVTGAPNTPPGASDLLIAPSTPSTTSDLVGSYTYSDVDGDSESGSEIRWYKDGALQSAYNDVKTVPSSATAKGQGWHFTVRPKDGEDFGGLETSPSVTIQNSAPVVSSLVITPLFPKTTDNLVGSYVYYDADGDSESGSQVRWYKNGVLQSAFNDILTVPSSATSKGETWYFEVRSNDGTSFGNWRASLLVTIPTELKHDIAVTNAAFFKTVICQGHCGNVSVEVENHGHFAETFNVTAYANMTEIDVELVTLASGDFMTIIFTWNTTGISKGNYTLSGQATPVPGETDTIDNTCTNGMLRVSRVGDIRGPAGGEGDGIVDIFDVVYVATCFGIRKGESRYQPNADISNNGVIDIFDIVSVTTHFGEEET